jgi:hypothetical protein
VHDFDGSVSPFHGGVAKRREPHEIDVVRVSARRKQRRSRFGLTIECGIY